MKVLITGETKPLSIAQMWYAERLGEVFEVEESDYEELFQTVSPIYKEHVGHIFKTDCKIIADQSTAYGTDCKGGQCE